MSTPFPLEAPLPLRAPLAVRPPLSGRTIPLADVPDDAFALGVLGDGIAIEPTEGAVRAPIGGRVEVLFPTGHAVALRSPEGVEVLLHIGIDSGQTEGLFRPSVAQGDNVRVGDLLVQFDLQRLRRHAKSAVTLVVITGMPEGVRLETSRAGQTVRAGEGAILTISPR